MPIKRKADASVRPLPSRRTARETKFLHLRQPVPVGHRIDGWRVCWAGGWDRGRLFFVVMVERPAQTTTAAGS